MSILINILHLHVQLVYFMIKTVHILENHNFLLFEIFFRVPRAGTRFCVFFQKCKILNIF